MARGKVNLNQARRTAVQVAEEAGALLRAGLLERVKARPKGPHGDVVTDLDLAAEKLVISRLQATFPGHRIVGEESGTHGGDGAWTWLVDPLDGTNNVAVGLPVYVVGLALCAEGIPVVGVVHEPMSGQTWSAIRDRGARGPNGPLRPVLRATPHGPVLGWTQGYGVTRIDDTARALKMTLELHAYRVLQLWAPLLCWVMLARGDIDGFVGYRAEMVDLPAGSLLAREAGIIITSFDGTPFDESDVDGSPRNFVAGHAERIPELLDLVRAASSIQPKVSALQSRHRAPLRRS